ncbi:MAG: nitroreductase family deazaflavin-dependent oxidoreductase [Acidobacteria bacterium]|nr:nitroreductase family deazaflavin-dependent oxidoreductase [Acidobacteriota bacterium]
MARRYQLSPKLRCYNRLMRVLLRWGLAPRNVYLLTVSGQKTGKPYSTPVNLVEKDHVRWLVAPYGEVACVRNARVAGCVTLTRGGRSEQARIFAVGPEESAPILKIYIGKIGIVRPYFDVSPDSPLEAFVAEAPLHPVFRLQIA